MNSQHGVISRAQLLALGMNARSIEHRLASRRLHPLWRGVWLGSERLCLLLDRPTVTLTTTELERLFLPLALKAGFPAPQTQAWLNGYRVDFYWREKTKTRPVMTLGCLPRA